MAVAATRYFSAAVARHSRALLLCALLALVPPSSGNSRVLTAANITWSSINFKTLLHWEPEPTNYFYTVEIDGALSNRERTCIRTTKTECDVTNRMRDVKDTYIARIYSEVPYSEDHFDSPPYAISPQFIPYTQTEIGMPTIKNFEQKGKTLKVEIEDPLTPLRFDNGSFQNIKDIFKDDLEYVLTYWKDQSTGKKWLTTKSNQFEFGIDEGKSYCFFVQANIVSPSHTNNRSGQKSAEQCTSVRREELDGLEFESILIIAAVAVGVLVLIIILSVVVYKCTRSKSARTKKESMPPNL